MRTHDVVVNLQGDLPTVAPGHLRAVIAPLSDPAVDIATLVAEITDPAEAARLFGGEGGLRVRTGAGGVAGAVLLAGRDPVG